MFGFIGDIVEGIGDVILGPKGGGQRGARIGGAIGSAFGAPKTGAVLGSSISQQVSGKQAVSSPTAKQSPALAAESSQSGSKVAYSRNSGYTDAFGVTPRQVSTLPVPRTPAGTAATIGAGAMGTAIDILYDAGDYLFGGDVVCGANGPSKSLLSNRRKADGSSCITVTRKQQHQLKQMVMYMGINETASYLGLSVAELASLLVKKFPPKRKGISAAQLRNAKRVNRTIMGMAKQLTDSCKSTTTRRR